MRSIAGRAVACARPMTRSMAVAPVSQARRVVLARADPLPEATESADDSSEKILQDLKEKWDAVENKPQVALYAGGSVFAVWLTGTVIGAINHLPVLPKLLELIGLSYSAWFTYRYLLFKTSREELIKDVEELKGKITGQ